MEQSWDPIDLGWGLHRPVTLHPWEGTAYSQGWSGQATAASPQLAGQLWSSLLSRLLSVRGTVEANILQQGSPCWLRCSATLGCLAETRRRETPEAYHWSTAGPT